MDENQNQNPIKSLVFSGGGQTFFSFYGIIKQAHIKNFWNYSDLESLYGTSAGAMVSLFISLQIEWEILDNYLIKRPWNKIFDLSIHSLSNIADKNGLFNKESILEIYKPLFLLKEIDIDITLKEFYEITKIDMHIFSTEVNKFESVDFNHISHPDWKVIDAVYCSLCVPVIFQPYICENCCFLDGGILLDFPINQCLEKYNEEEVFAIKKYGKEVQNISTDTNLIDFINIMFNKSLKKILNSERKVIKNTVFIQDNQVSLEEILNITSSQELREATIQNGINHFDEFITKLSENV
tara:strand:- start:858 stop:1745 length:888 start_codon:yes stop_codon:yes gene_type:complete